MLPTAVLLGSGVGVGGGILSTVPIFTSEQSISFFLSRVLRSTLNFFMIDRHESPETTVYSISTTGVSVGGPGVLVAVGLGVGDT